MFSQQLQIKCQTWFAPSRNVSTPTQMSMNTYLFGQLKAKTFSLALYASILNMRSNVRGLLNEVTVENVTFYLRVFSYISVLEINALCVLYLVSIIWRCHNYLDTFTYSVFNLVKSLVFGPIFLACNDYIKLVTLLICWVPLQFALGVFRIVLCSIKMYGK
jgi:hypothetical protein